MNELLSQQSRLIAHEIRNQISICELYTQIIKRNLEKKGIQDDSFDNAINCITKGLKLMNNSLLDLKSLDNFSLKYCDIRALLEDSINLSRVYINEKNININFYAEDSAIVYVDENKFTACIINIIKNAVEAIENKGEIKVSLEIHQSSSAVIKITNNGKPIEHCDKIFEEGFTTKSSGCGLGLHICSENLKKQNAELKLTKSTSETTEFEITLPINQQIPG